VLCIRSYQGNYGRNVDKNFFVLVVGLHDVSMKEQIVVMLRFVVLSCY
jgi:hypothetical protein